MKRVLWLFCLAVTLTSLLFGMVACGKDNDEQTDAKAESIELKANGLSGDTLSLYVGKEVTIALTVKPTGKTFSADWSSSDTTVVSVTSSGVVKGVSAGNAKISISAGEITREISVNVAPYIPVSSIAFAESEIEVETGVRQPLSFTVNPENATVKTLSFSVSPENAGVKVSSAGIIEVENGIEGGTVYEITARAFQDPTVFATLRVTVQTYQLTDIQIVDNDFHTVIDAVTAPLDEPYRVLFQMPVPEKAIAPGKRIPTVWTSSDESVCTVNGKGRLTFHKVGTATITMEAMGFTKQIPVTVTEKSGNFIENYRIPSSYINAVSAITAPTADGWCTFADFREGGTGSVDAKKFVMEKYKYATGPSSWFAGGGYCIEMGGWDNIHSGLEDDDLEGGGLANLFMWCKLTLGQDAAKVRAFFQYRETDATFKYKLRFTVIVPDTKEVIHLSNWLTGDFKTDPNLAAGETFIESNLPESCKGKTVLLLLEYDDIDYTTDGILNGVESVNIKYFSVLNYDGQPIENALWVIGDSIMTEDYTGTMTAEIAQEADYTLFRDTISGSTVAPASSVGIVDHIDRHFYTDSFGLFGAPKVIVIQRGSNDVFYGTDTENPISLGEPDSTDKTTVYGAVRYTLDYFTELYPDAKIIWSTAVFREDIDDAQIRAFNENLKTICAAYDNVQVLDLYTASGFCAQNAVQYLTDGIHPTNSGKAILKQLWIDELTK